MRTAQQICEEAFASHTKGNLDEAVRVYDNLLGKLDEPEPNVLFGYGSALVQKGQYGAGIFMLRAALGLADKHVGIWTNLGVAYKYIGRDELALHCYNMAHELDPAAPEPIASLAGYWINRDEPDKVVDYARQALALDPQAPSAHMHLGLGLLEQGKFSEAWPHYEYRWETLDRMKDKRPYKAPRWNGEWVHTLAIHGEQGLGDEIMFMSLFPKLTKLADNIVIECAERLIPTFRQAFGVSCYKDHASLIEAQGEPNAYIPMGSLPGILGLPDGKAYLPKPLRAVHDRPRIGIAWKGGTERTNEKDRSLKLSDLSPILSACDADFVSVQYGSDDVDAEASEMGLELGGRDFDSLQRRIGSCDLVISVCQTSVHQAGAMGIPCWVLTPKKAAWRYRGDTMPWYKSVRLFRQSEAGEWDSVIKAIASELTEKYGRVAA